MDDSGSLRTVALPTLHVIHSLFQKKEVAALIDRFPHIKQRLDCLLSAAALSDVPSARPEILNLLGLSEVDISVGMLLRERFAVLFRVLPAPFVVGFATQFVLVASFTQLCYIGYILVLFVT
jgi:hypothetical protein